MSRLTRDGTAEPVSRNQSLRHVRNINFPCSSDHEEDWQPYPVDPYSAICDDHTYVHTVTEATKSLSWAETGFFRVVAISCLRNLRYRAAGRRARVICPSCISKKHFERLADKVPV